MSDEIGFERPYKLTIEGLYRHRGYIDPEYGSWENWYAWYPVKRITWGHFSGRLIQQIAGPDAAGSKIYRWEWRTHLLRRRVTSNGALFRRKSQWEYTTMEEALRWT